MWGVGLDDDKQNFKQNDCNQSQLSASNVQIVQNTFGAQWTVALNMSFYWHSHSGSYTLQKKFFPQQDQYGAGLAGGW